MMELQSLAKVLIVVGVILAAMGALLYAAGHLSIPIGRLPGDIRIERPGVRFYLPITTSIIVSILLTLLFFVFSRFR
jgi:hypothetical protein